MKKATASSLVAFAALLGICYAAESDEKESDEVVVMEPMVVSADTQLSFGFSLTVVRQQPENRVLAMYVERVGEGTDAERKGLKAGSQVLSIDGRAVGEYEATFRSGSELCRIFIGRDEGAKVLLEVLPPGKKKKTHKITVVRKTIFLDRPKIGALPVN